MASILIQIPIPYQLYTEHIKIKNNIKSLKFSTQIQVIKINSTLLFQK
nr:MAG TPA: Red carotenoid protein (RCP), photoprotection, cyanobacteria, CARTENOID BINDING [Caudoviricetes sp.]